MGFSFYWSIEINAIDLYMSSGLKAALYSHFLVMYFFFYTIIFFLLVLTTAVLTQHERRIIADIQMRRGPAKVGPLGVLQPIADAFKLLLKEFITPRHVQEYFFWYVSSLSFVFAAFFWVVVPFGTDAGISTGDLSLFILFLSSILHIYTILIGGWASSSKYAFLGSIRTGAQLISYDVVVLMVYICLFMFAKEFSLMAFADFQSFMGCFLKFLPAHGVLFAVGGLAEMNRHPFDLPEAEAELVSGYNVEYSSIRFAMFFLSEYSSMIYYAFLINTTFFNPFVYTSILFFILRISLVTIVIILCRAALPRYRYDQLMSICWKFFVPLEFAFVVNHLTQNFFLPYLL